MSRGRIEPPHGASALFPARASSTSIMCLTSMAEREGFEPSIQLETVWRFSKALPSATRPPLRNGGYARQAAQPQAPESAERRFQITTRRRPGERLGPSRSSSNQEAKKKERGNAVSRCAGLARFEPVSARSSRRALHAARKRSLPPTSETRSPAAARSHPCGPSARRD